MEKQNNPVNAENLGKLFSLGKDLAEKLPKDLDMKDLDFAKGLTQEQLAALAKKVVALVSSGDFDLDTALDTLKLPEGARELISEKAKELLRKIQG